MRGKDGDTVYNHNTLLLMDYGVLSVNLNLFKSGNTMLKMQYYDLNASILFCSDLHKKPRANKMLYPLTTKNIGKKIINNKLTSNLSSNPCVGFNYSARDKNYYL